MIRCKERSFLNYANQRESRLRPTAYPPDLPHFFGPTGIAPGQPYGTAQARLRTNPTLHFEREAATLPGRVIDREHRALRLLWHSGVNGKWSA